MSSSSSDSDTDAKPVVKPAVNPAEDDSDSAPSHRSNSPPAQAPSANDSDASPSASPRKARMISSSEEDSDTPRKPKAKVEHQIFGEDVSSSDEERPPSRTRDSDEGSDGGQREREGRVEEDEEMEDREEEDVPTIIEAEATAVDVDIPSYNPTFVRLPNFLSIEKRPFEPEYYDEDEDDEALDVEGKNRLKLRVENTIRWKFGVDEHGDEVKHSNAKMVKWSDGTSSLYLGSEVFDVQVLPLHDHNHLFIRQGSGLAGQAVFSRKFNFRPHSTDSETHKKVTLTMAERTRKSGQVKMLSNVGKNPDAEKQELVRKEEEMLRAAIRRETAQRKTRERRYGGLSSSFLEGRDDEDDEDSLNAIKRSYKKGGSRYDDRPLIGASDSDESEEGEGGRESRLKEAQKDQEDDDSDEDFGRKKTQQPQRKTIVTSDEESS